MFQHVRGVRATAAGYDGGAARDAAYEKVATGLTGHHESVAVTYDPRVITYGQLLQLFFSVALDPTDPDGQYPDRGPQYMSVVFVRDAAQRRVAEAYLAQLRRAAPFADPVATQIAGDTGFYPAEPEHQDFLVRHPDDLYIVTYDQPKVQALRRLFPARFVARPEQRLAGGEGLTATR